MVVNMTHNESVKTFDDIVRHLKLEVGRLVVARPNEQAYVAESSSRKTSGFKHSAAADHIARDQGAYIEFRRISSGTRWIYVGNNSKVEVKGIRTCEIDRDLHFYEIMDPDIRSTPKQQLMLEPSESELIEGEVHIVTQYDDAEPNSVQVALTCLTKDEWRKAMEEELESMRKNQVWDLVDLPSNQKAIGTKGLLK
ncbi:hypothetical protein CK203_048286 [Vitis vinifera]|uniref:Retrovirus-related Pol polyprotein from transposon TNT 1-94 n=1 Tax=Vitis vinifera TaxID=29760 RepID=A0A438H0S1_VITVI|nr:hypothetical protein CK203_048286 [Vitis vinifera]